MDFLRQKLLEIRTITENSDVNILDLHQVESDGNQFIYKETEKLFGGEKNVSVTKMCSSDYLDLKNNRQIKDIAISIIENNGLGRDGNSYFGGETVYHTQLKETLIEMYGGGCCVLTSSGTISNFVVTLSMVEANLCDVFFSDEFNHATIIAGIKYAQSGRKKVEKVIFKHRDYNQLEHKLAEYRETNKCSKIVIITDGVFSMHGTIANIPKLLELSLKYDAYLVIDECHSLGVLGLEKGCGTLEHYHQPWNDKIIITGTFGKSIPTNGGFIVSAKTLKSEFTFSSFKMFTGIPTAYECGIANKSLEIIQHSKFKREALYSLVRKWREIILEIYKSCDIKDDKRKVATIDFYEQQLSNPTPIIPFFVSQNSSTNLAQKINSCARELLLSQKLYLVPIMYPAVPINSDLFRFLITLSTDNHQLENVWKNGFATEVAKLYN